MAATTVASLAVEITGNTSGLDRAMGKADQSVKGFGGRISGALDSMGGMGTLALGALGGAALKFGADSVASAVQFETAMTNVNSILQLSQDEIGQLSAEVLKIGGDSRAGPQRVAEAFYEIVGGVADASTHMAILNASIATAEAGNADLTGTTSALISVMNSYSYEAEKAGYVSDILTKTVGAGVGSMDEFASAMGMSAGLAAQSGISFTELGGAMAFLTTQGFSAAQAGTRLTAIQTAFLKPNDKMKKALKAMGLESGSAGLEMYGLAGMTELLSDAMGGSTDAMSEALGTTEALTGALALNNPKFDDFIEGFEDTAEGATEAARAIQNASTQAGLDNLSSSFERLKDTVGGAITPVINVGANIVSGVLDLGSDILTQAGNWGRQIGEAFYAGITGTVVVTGATVEDSGAIATALEDWFIANHSFIVGTPLEIAFPNILVAADTLDTLVETMTTSFGGIEPVDVLSAVAVSFIPPSVSELAAQAGALVTQLNETGITPGMRMALAVPVKVEKILTTAEQLGAELSTLWNTTVTMLTPIAVLPDGVSIMPTGMPWLDSFLGAAAAGASAASAADSPAGVGTMTINTDLAIIPGGISYTTTGVPWIDAVLNATAQGEQTLEERTALNVGIDARIGATVVDHDVIITDVTGQTNTILDEAAIAVDTPATIAVDATLGNGMQVVTAVTGDLQSQNFDTTAFARMTLNVEVTRVMNFVDAAIGHAPGMNLPSAGGGPDGDNNPATPMATGGKVPYDNFAALLHKGEIVVPANYADGVMRGMGGGGPVINLYANNLLGNRQEVIEWVREGMAEAGY